MMTDSIADMLTRIRNATMTRLERTDIPRSKMKEEIARILKEEGFIADYRVKDDLPSTITVFLKYGDGRTSAIAGIRRRSRPGRRHYVGYRDIPTVLNGLGVAILSTSSGVMTDRQARHKKVGGELLAEVW